jgi:hypothetical protein
MDKLVTVESGSIVPLDGTSGLSDGDGVIEGGVITKKTWLIIDGNDITLADKHGFHLIGTYENHNLELDEKSNCKEKSLFFIKLRSAFALHLQNFIVRCKSFFIRAFQTIFRKSHISNWDLIFFDSYLAKRILPHIKAYRKQYLKYDGLVNNAPLGMPRGGN